MTEKSTSLPWELYIQVETSKIFEQIIKKIVADFPESDAKDLAAAFRYGLDVLREADFETVDSESHRQAAERVSATIQDFVDIVKQMYGEVAESHILAEVGTSFDDYRTGGVLAAAVLPYIQRHMKS